MTSNIFYEIFKIMKDLEKPVTQKEIIEKLIEAGFSKSKAYEFFTPSILQPFFDSEQKDFVHPIIIPVQTNQAKPLFMLNKLWKNITYENEEKLKKCLRANPKIILDI